MLSDGEKRDLVAEAEKHVEIVRCGNPRHTNFAVGCPDCGVFCEWCDDEWPCLPRRLADALEASLPQDDRDDHEARERLLDVLSENANWEWANAEEAREWGERRVSEENEAVADDPDIPSLVCVVVRRRKAGPWEPLPVRGESNG